MHNVTVSMIIRQLLFLSPYFDYMNLFSFLSFMTGCNQVGFQGGSSSSLKSGDLRDGGRGPVGCADGLGDGAEVGELILSNSLLFMLFLN